MYVNLCPAAVAIKADLDQTIQLARAHGFAGIDLPLEEVAKLPDPNIAAEKLHRASLRWGGFGLPVDFRQDQTTYEKGLTQLKQWAPIARSLGCTRTSTWILPGHNQLDERTNFDLHVQRLQPVAALLSEHDIRLGLEFVGPKTLRDTLRYPFIHTMERMLELCDAIRPTHMGLLLDSFHWYTSGATAADLLDELTNERIVYVHVNDGYAGRERDQQLDGQRALPGETGIIDATRFVRALKKLRYDGPIAAEPFMPQLGKLSSDMVASRVARCIRHMLALVPG